MDTGSMGRRRRPSTACTLSSHRPCSGRMRSNHRSDPPPCGRWSILSAAKRPPSRGSASISGHQDGKAVHRLQPSLRLIEGRWKLAIIAQLLQEEGLRFSQLRSGTPGISANVLTQKLRELQQAGLVARTTSPPPVQIEYQLTAAGRELAPAIMALLAWAEIRLRMSPET